MDLNLTIIKGVMMITADRDNQILLDLKSEDNWVADGIIGSNGTLIVAKRKDE